MKIFIWEGIDRLTTNYHENGGLAVIAKDIERALEIAENYKGENKYCNIILSDEEKVSYVSYELKDDCEEKVFVFQDAGCC